MSKIMHKNRRLSKSAPSSTVVKFDEKFTESPTSENDNSEHSQDEPSHSPPRIAKKRINEDHEEEFGSEMQKMLKCFGADISKTLETKKKKLEQLTQNSLKSSNDKIDDFWKAQRTKRQKLQEEYGKQIGTVITQWETDIEKTKEQEQELTNLFKQQQKVIQQARIVQSQRLKTIQQLHQQLTKGIEELDKYHASQQYNVQSELKKEMSLLQKKILMDTQQQEMANVRKSLQTMLF